MPTFAIIDLETTGGKASRHRIIEAAIVLSNGKKVVNSWSSLINPETYIPAGITDLTGISQEMVEDAPRFFEVARKIVEMTKTCVFVAHNVRFDYGFLQEEFRRLGYSYSRRKLCTVHLSRKNIPGLPSYSLGRLCTSLGITVENRHRALGDAMATAEVLHRILNARETLVPADDLINLGLRESLLPPGMSIDFIHQLPEACGVYYLHNAEGEVIYVGKSINIQKRIAEHFGVQTQKARRMQQHVRDVTYELTGSELIALLLESHEIKRLNPALNQAQKLRDFPYVIYQWINEEGYLCFGTDRVDAKARKKLQVVSEYPKLAYARGRLAFVQKEFELCEHLLKRHAPSGACFSFHLKQCQGACVGREAPNSYNERALKAIERLNTIFEHDFVLFDRGRCNGEQSIVLIKDGNYAGFGYVDAEVALGKIEDHITPYPGNPETRKIIQRYLSKPKKEIRVKKL